MTEGRLARQRRKTAIRRAREGTTTQRGYGHAYQVNRKLVLQRDNYTCQLRLNARCKVVATTADHVVPRSHGGGHELTNLRAACSYCNAARGNGALTPRPRGRSSRSWL